MEQTPIACTLTGDDLRDRQAAWLKLGEFLIDSKPTPGGLSLNFRSVPGLPRSLAELVRLEEECCAWMALEIDEQPQTVHLSITGEGESGEQAVREAFRPLTG